MLSKYAGECDQQTSTFFFHDPGEFRGVWSVFFSYHDASGCFNPQCKGVDIQQNNSVKFLGRKMGELVIMMWLRRRPKKTSTALAGR